MARRLHHGAGCHQRGAYGPHGGYTIFIKNGKYREKVSVPSNKPFLQLIGESMAKAIISWDDYSGKPMPGGGTYGTSNSATLMISAPDVSALNITVENTTGDAPQALALNVSADRMAFKNCRFLGGQDTVLTNMNGGRFPKSSLSGSSRHHTSCLV